jgi:hypothetical protein
MGEQLRELEFDTVHFRPGAAEALGQLHGLQKLTLRYVLRDTPREIAASGGNTRVVHDLGDDWSFLAELTALRELELSDCHLRDEELRHLRGLHQLERLDLSGNPITDTGLELLRELKNLRTLRVERTRVTSKGFDRLRETLPSLEL